MTSSTRLLTNMESVVNAHLIKDLHRMEDLAPKSLAVEGRFFLEMVNVDNVQTI